MLQKLSAARSTRGGSPARNPVWRPLRSFWCSGFLPPRSPCRFRQSFKLAERRFKISFVVARKKNADKRNVCYSFFINKLFHIISFQKAEKRRVRAQAYAARFPAKSKSSTRLFLSFKTLFELIDTPAGVNKFLFTGIERMAF
jgi:hypothetical protein